MATIQPMAVSTDLSTQNPASHESQIVTFINGIPGFPNYTSFRLVDLDDGAYPPLKLLISRDNPAISFILYPHKNDTSLYDSNTLQTMQNKQKNGYSQDVYSIVTIRQDTSDYALTTNLQAPIVIDPHDFTGRQVIQNHPAWDPQHPLERFSASGNC